MKKAYFNWSSGKDSALALYKILRQKEYQVEKLITTISKNYKRVSMHGLDEKLLDKQVETLGIPLKKIYLPENLTIEMYNKKMKQVTSKLKSEGFENAIFGDILLEDLRKHRDKKLAEVGIKGVYPLWKRNTKKVLKEFIDLDFKAITVCTSAKLMGKEYVGKVIDKDFIKDLPKNVDVCGENGEFHTFCFDGPIFKNPVSFKIGEKVLKNYRLRKNDDDNCQLTKDKIKKNIDVSFWYCDLQI